MDIFMISQIISPSAYTLWRFSGGSGGGGGGGGRRSCGCYGRITTHFRCVFVKSTKIPLNIVNNRS